MGASGCGAAFSHGVGRACARQGARTRDGAQAKIAALGACTVERTGPCVRSERESATAHARTRARAQVQGPGRGDRGTIAALFARTTPMERAARAVAA
jgi:hypothetical protein